jgi:diketogulonate reductase-like aldo/keto reductase
MLIERADMTTEMSTNGVRIPALGFGTYSMSARDIGRMVPAALRAGFRHIDTAQIYGNEAAIGEAVTQAGVRREKLFLTTKVWVENYHPTRFAASVDRSLRNLQSGHIDLLLLHWPSNAVPLADQIGALEATVTAGKVRHIGVSNFNSVLLEEATRLARQPLLTNQVEYHPYLPQSVLFEQMRRAQMAVTAYCPMAVGRVLKEPLLLELALRYRRSVAQIVLRWVVQQGIVALSSTVSERHVAENTAIFDFALSDDDMTAIAALSAAHRRIVNPPGLAPAWDRA